MRVHVYGIRIHYKILHFLFQNFQAYWYRYLCGEFKVPFTPANAFKICVFRETLYIWILQEIAYLIFRPVWEYWCRYPCHGYVSLFIQINAIVHTFFMYTYWKAQNLYSTFVISPMLCVLVPIKLGWIFTAFNVNKRCDHMRTSCIYMYMLRDI